MGSFIIHGNSLSKQATFYAENFSLLDEYILRALLHGFLRFISPAITIQTFRRGMNPYAYEALVFFDSNDNSGHVI